MLRSQQSMATTFQLVVLLIVAELATVWAAEPNQYLIISQPELAKVVYVKFSWDAPSQNLRVRPKSLIEDLNEPQGLAVDPKLSRLFVTDPKQRKIVRYDLAFSEGDLVLDGGAVNVAQDVDAKWVAVDGVGNIYFTNGKRNLIQMVYAVDILAEDPTRVRTIYKQNGLESVSSPGGLAVDNFHLFWANRAMGTEQGSLVKALMDPPETPDPHEADILARNTLKAYGVCLGATNIFYTGDTNNVYGVKETGGKAVLISDKLVQPRGVVWDGDGTVYVADQRGNSIYSFASSMHELGASKISLVASVPGPFGLAMISAAYNHVLDPLHMAALSVVTLLTCL